MSGVAAGTRPLPARAGGLRRSTVAILLALAVFGLYGVSTGNLVGYEDETAAVSEGLVKAGELRVLDGTPLTAQGISGREGHRYSRTGLTQPVLEAPFYWIGEQLDHIASNGKSYRWRLDALRLYNPAMATLTVLAIFGLLLLRGVSDRRALGVAALCAVATLIWPYSKIGMDTTLMAMLALALLAGAWTAARPTAARFALAGIGAGLTVNTKPYGALLLVGVVPLLVGPFKALLALPRKRSIRALVAFALPVICALAAIGWYDWYRTGSVTDFVDTYVSRLLATPIGAIGLFLSPGKGLVLYSPLVFLGLLSLRTLWRADRALALSVGLTVAVNTLFIATSLVWADETWGPRYLIPSAWMLVLPLAWWARGRRRLGVVGALATVGVCVQLAGVLANYGVTVPAASALAGEPAYQFAHAAYGDDGPRWVPQASPLLFGLELVAAYVKEHLTGSGFVVSYQPFRGRQATIDLRAPEKSFGPLPDFWWTFPGRSEKEELLALLLGALALGAGGLLVAARGWGLRHLLAGGHEANC
ncbi:MAG: hypothetical protein M3Y17_13305 [Actinomycetota bacterium]|nr:hypothetical protein [Actinomycetota bacterium]